MGHMSLLNIQHNQETIEVLCENHYSHKYRINYGHKSLLKY